MLGAVLMGLGGSGPVAFTASAVDSAFGGGTASATFTVKTDGTTQASVLNGGNTGGNWWRPSVSGIGNNFWVRLTGSGDSPGTTGTWQQLSSNRSWTLSQTGAGVKSFSGTLEIAADSGGANIVHSEVFYLEAAVGA